VDLLIKIECRKSEEKNIWISYLRLNKSMGMMLIYHKHFKGKCGFNFDRHLLVLAQDGGDKES